MSELSNQLTAVTAKSVCRLFAGQVWKVGSDGPYRDRTGINAVGVWFAPERRKQNLVFIGICLLIIAFTIIGTFLRGPYWNFYWPWEAWPPMPLKF